MNMADMRGGVSGTVRNATGAVVSGATVTATNADNGAQFTATTDAQGAYAFGALPAGKYNLSIESAGLTAFRQTGVEVTADRTLPLNITLTAANAAQAAETDRQDLLQKIATLEQRISDLESSAVLSEPETRVRRVEVFVDDKGNEHDAPVPGAKPAVTYQRERVYRRQTINEKIEAALEDAEKRKVGLGVSAAISPQFARQTRGEATGAGGNAYQLASADLFFTAGVAQYTLFYADIVGLSGTPPDLEISGLTLLNGYSARLVRQNEISLREAWLRTELFSQRLALTAGRLDLTNFFDRNAAANDETTQFLSDALVNNPVLGLATNGSGFAAAFDPKNGLNLKLGFQQSNPEATNLSDSIFTLAEVGYLTTLPSLGEGNYRAWYRATNAGDRTTTAWGLSLDQKVAPQVTLFGRYGDGHVPGADETGTSFSAGQHFWSGGVQFQKGLIFNPSDSWGIGYARTGLAGGDKEKLVEGYYNFQLSEKLRLSFHLTHALESPAGTESVGFLVPGIRLQASF